MRLVQFVLLGSAVAFACSGGSPPQPSGTPGGASDPGGGTQGNNNGGTNPPAGWRNQLAIGTPRDANNVEIYGEDVDLNEQGTGIAVWEEAGSTFGTVWVAWFRDGVWGSPLQLSDVGTHAVLPRVGLNDLGDAVVAWEVVGHDSLGGIPDRTVWARRWTGAAWTSPVRLSDPPPAPYTLYAWRPRVGIDASGRALVSWDQDDVSDANAPAIVASRFDGTIWKAPEWVSDGTLPSAWSDAASSAGGISVVVWVQDTNPYDPNKSGGGPRIPNIWTRTYTGGSWTAPQRIGTADLVDFEGCERPAVVMDASGRAFAIWEEHRLNANRVVAARFDPAGGGWSAPVAMAASLSNVDYLSFPSIATDGNGNGFAVWQSTVAATGAVNGAGARFEAAGGAWTQPSEFESGGAVSAACAAMDGASKGWALFTRGSSLVARRFDPTLGWQPETLLGPGTASDAEANGAGMVILGAQAKTYASSPPFFLTAAYASVYVP
ncbi:MAG TPA: hypothetical protein VE782_17750 [Myxococcaceae bacterium]|nr:hypothetical protein [Myxococcaceae bacterium]